MAIPDHYIPNLNNAHIDTSTFESDIAQLLSTPASSNNPGEYPCQEIYGEIASRVHHKPVEPNDDQLICRYLSPLKFLWFVSQMTIHFTRADRFEDASDSLLPMDYHNAVLVQLTRHKLDCSAWCQHIRKEQSHWFVSCWTKLDCHHDDNLLWHSYAGGAHGVGVTVRYKLLRDHLTQAMKKEHAVKNFYSGEIDYQGLLKVAPFNKRAIFRNEKEVRFVAHATPDTSVSVDVQAIKSEFRLRLSSESPYWHRKMVADVWQKFGGTDEIHVAGE